MTSGEGGVDYSLSADDTRDSGDIFSGGTCPEHKLRWRGQGRTWPQGGSLRTQCPTLSWPLHSQLAPQALKLFMALKLSLSVM